MKKQVNLQLSSGLTDSYASSLHTDLGAAKSAWRDSKLVELKEKEDINRSEQLEAMGLKRPDQMMGAGQGALPMDNRMDNPSFMKDIKVDHEDISLEEDDFPDYQNKDLREQYGSVPIQSKSLPAFVLKNASSPVTLKAEQRAQEPPLANNSGREVESIDPSLSVSHYELDWFKDENSKFTVSKEDALGSSRLSSEGAENLQELRKELHEGGVIIEEDEAEEGEGLSNASIRRKEMMKTNPMLWKKKAEANATAQNKLEDDGLDVVDINHPPAPKQTVLP